MSDTSSHPFAAMVAALLRRSPGFAPREPSPGELRAAKVVEERRARWADKTAASEYTRQQARVEVRNLEKSKEAAARLNAHNKRQADLKWRRAAKQVAARKAASPEPVPSETDRKET